MRNKGATKQKIAQKEQEELRKAEEAERQVSRTVATEPDTPPVLVVDAIQLGRHERTTRRRSEQRRGQHNSRQTWTTPQTSLAVRP